MNVAVMNVEPSESVEMTDPPEGYRREWARDDRSRPATVAENETRRCRRPGCDGHPVLAFRRKTGEWLYCAEHLYGRRIRDGVVEFPKLVPVEP